MKMCQAIVSTVDYWGDWVFEIDVENLWYWTVEV